MKNQTKNGRIPSQSAMGDLWLDFDWKEITDYKRSLDLDEAISCTEFKSEGYQVIQETFASAPNRAILIKLHTTHPGGFRCLIRMDRLLDKNFPTAVTKAINRAC